MLRIQSILAIGLVGLALAACEDEEVVFNEIDRLRILAIAADKPWIREDETAQLTFLGANGDPEIDDASLGTRWHLCPVQADSTTGFECLVQSAEEVEALLGITLPPPLAAAEFGEFGLVIGTATTAELPFPVPAQALIDFCADENMNGTPDAFEGVDLPPFVTLPQCNGRFPVTVYLEYGPVIRQDPFVIDPDERVVAFTDVQLLYDPAVEPNPPNRNPTIAALSVSPNDANAFVPTSSTTTTVLKYDTTYDLRIDVPPEEAEEYVSSDDDIVGREVLTATWFIEGGQTDSTRTGFLPVDDCAGGDGKTGCSFADLVENEWTTPSRNDFTIDGELRRDARLYIVLRDDRGGVSWIVRPIRFDDADGL